MHGESPTRRTEHVMHIAYPVAAVVLKFFFLIRDDHNLQIAFQWHPLPPLRRHPAEITAPFYPLPAPSLSSSRSSASKRVSVRRIDLNSGTVGWRCCSVVVVDVYRSDMI
ncbi:hypothetical protein AKJ16_DCAP10738 [Drosera capensis]